MAEGENRSGLLSKMAKFVLNPNTDWSKLDQGDEIPASGYSKDALKEMIERKRQNDFVRKREFDHLRKLRRRDILHPPDLGGRPSFFQSSMASNHDDRAQTLKKIDEIEAQMSRQWWKGKDAAAGGFPVSSKQELRTDPAGATLIPDALPIGADADAHDENDLATAPASMEHQARARLYSPTVPMSLDKALEPAPPAPEPAAPAPSARSRPTPLAAGRHPIGAGFSTQRLYTTVPTMGLGDAELEDAAIRYANGDLAGAENSLLEALMNQPEAPAEQVESRMAALFDLYRATGQQARFDSMAIDLANRYGRSPPAWFSLPELLGVKRDDARESSFQVISMEENQPDWLCPARLTAADLSVLQARGREPSLVLDWHALIEIAPDGVPLLALLVSQWSVSQISLTFRHHTHLERALQKLTPSGDRSVAPMNWQLRMDALRIMRLQNEFELVALDYCVTYEVSPPSWQEPRCTCTLKATGESVPMDSILANTDWDAVLESLTAPANLDEPPPGMVELVGEIEGDAADALQRMETGMSGTSRLVVSCARLMRVDFTAAGSILEWVSTQQAKGCQVQFHEVNRMVAVFLRVIGIAEHARVVPRVS